MTRLAIEDLPAVLEVEVTAAHIVLGRKLNCYRCPIALACQDAYPVEYGWKIGNDAEPLGGPLRIYRLDITAKLFVGAFDWDEPVQPCTITLREVKR
jgi:hypothetical protein